MTILSIYRDLVVSKKQGLDGESSTNTKPSFDETRQGWVQCHLKQLSRDDIIFVLIYSRLVLSIWRRLEKNIYPRYEAR